MMTAELGGRVAVPVGEVFGVSRRGRETSGYQMKIEAPAGIVCLPAERGATEGIGGMPRVIERFRAERPGIYVIRFFEGRAWEQNPTLAMVEVTAA